MGNMNAVLPAIAQPSVERRSRQQLIETRSVEMQSVETQSIKVQVRKTPVRKIPVGRIPAPQSWRWRRALWQGLSSTLGCTLAIACGSFSPVRAAERVYVTYGIFGSSISLDSLETFAADGTIERDLAFYTQYVSDEQRQQLRDFLTTRASVNHVAVAQFLYTPQGETLLRRAGEIIQTEGRQSGFLALRSALILAAADPEQGLTPLNVIRNFPISGIRVDVERTLEIARELEQLINQTNIAIATIEQQSALEAATAYTTDFSTLPDLRVRGPYGWNSRSFSFIDRSRPTAPDSLYRSRSFKADLYIPQAKGDRPLPDRFPIIVISHGLGSDRASYAYLAQHLATHGFAVAIPDHPGSNAAQFQALLNGQSNDVVRPSEFIDRPLDVKYLLDQLELQNNANFQGRLNLQQVGIIGQSFGGYTALILSGANIDTSQLSRDCSLRDNLNLSLLLQCRALALSDLNLEQTTLSLRDDRIKAVIAINPIGGSLLGERGFRQIAVPVMMLTGNADTVAPSLPEQIHPFTWLNTPDKYLVLLRGTTHFSTIGESLPGSDAVSLPAELVGPDPAIARRYLSAMSVAFFTTYLYQESSYHRYLESGYARYISQSPVPLWLVSSLTSEQLSEALGTRLPQTSHSGDRSSF